MKGKLVIVKITAPVCVGPTLVHDHSGECSRGGAATSLIKAHTLAKCRGTDEDISTVGFSRAAALPLTCLGVVIP